MPSLGFGLFDSDGGTGSVRATRVWGLPARDVAYISRGFSRACRTIRDTRRDGMDGYHAMFVISGRTTLVQNDRISELAAGECALVDMARPVSVMIDSGRMVAVPLPRQSLTSHLGFEPSGGTCWNGAIPASRLLFRLVSSALTEADTSFAAAEPHMQLALYDLLGALFAISDLPSNSAYTDRLFSRVCNIARSHFSDPELTLRDVAGEAGPLRVTSRSFSPRAEQRSAGSFSRSALITQNVFCATDN